MKADRVVAIQIDGGLEMPLGVLPFSAPTLVVGLRGSTLPLHDPSLPADELEIFLSSFTGTVSSLWSSTRSAPTASWNPAVMVSELSGAYNDLGPDVSTDGLTLYFSSDRAGAGHRLYVSRRTARGQPWGSPEEMLGLGTSTLDMGPSVAPDGLFMAFASQRGTTDIRLYAAARTDPLGTWETVQELTGINSGSQDQDPALSEQTLSLTWGSRRTGNGLTSDLFQVDRPTSDVPFSALPTPLDTLNSLDWDGEPWVSQDGHHIFFVSDRNGGNPQIYEAWR
jgi:Tol biopolymer transport system component